MKYVVEMCYGIGLSVDNIEADSEEEAIQKAKKMVSEEITVLDGQHVDAGNLEYESVTFIAEQK